MLIRATLGSSAGEIAQLLGRSTATVHVLHSRWADAWLVRSSPFTAGGGRHHLYLTPEQEQELSAPFVQRAQAGGMQTAAEGD